MTPTEWFTLALVIATLLLVGPTWYYAVQTRRMVDEMRRTNAAPTVWVYAHYASADARTIWSWAHASGVSEEQSGIQSIAAPGFRNLYLMVMCDRETDLSKAWFEFDGQRLDADTAQGPLPTRLLPSQRWIGWITWDRVPAGFTEAQAPLHGRAILTVTGEAIHEAKPTPPNLMLGGNVPGRS
jgi:hypothetical protein